MLKQARASQVRRCSARTAVASRPLQRTCRKTSIQCAVAATTQLSSDLGAGGAESAPAPGNPVVKLTPTELTSFLQEGTICAVMFTSENCGPCKLMGPEFKKLASCFPSFKFGSIIVTESNEHEQVASMLRVRAVPAFRVYCNGKRMEEVAGARPTQLRQMLLHYYRPL